MFETLAAQLLGQKNSIRFRAAGSSMRPFILDGDDVEIQPVAPPTLKRGDIVLICLSSGRLLLHRVVQVRPHKFLIQGDALLVADGWVDSDQVLGKVSAIYRQGKHIDPAAPLRMRLGWLWLAVAPLRCRFQPGLQALWRVVHRRKPNL